jgi:signal transduction histidine kinase
LVEVEPSDLSVRADREKLGQVLSNLLDNAVRYSPEGGTITVSARGRSKAAEITVADEGIGMSEPDQQRAFAKFFRSERAAAGQGTGLGLFLVRGLVTAMGGRIWLESEESRGSRFTFELPLTGAEDVESPRVEAAAT